MKKKVALVLGGSGGIGFSAVERLLSDGFIVCATYLTNKDKLKKISDGLDSTLIEVFQCDLSNVKNIHSLIKKISLLYGEIDVVTFSASSKLTNNRILNLEWDEYTNLFDLQVKPVFQVVKYLSKQLKAKHKTKFIILLTEYCVGSPPKGLSHYVTSKYASMGLAKTMAVELAEFNSTVNMISPGMVETDFLDNLPAKLIEITSLQNPLKRNASPQDISNAISFLASNQSDYLNGENMIINGGKVIH